MRISALFIASLRLAAACHQSLGGRELEDIVYAQKACPFGKKSLAYFF